MQKLIGYVTIADLALMIPEDIKALDVINLAFGHVVDGEVVCAHLASATEEMARVRSINPDLKIVLSVGGWSAGGFSEAAFTQEGREKFARTAGQIVREYGLDGIDVDWEYPCISIAGIKAAPEDKENFTLLLAELRKDLDGITDRYCTVTIAGGGDRYYTRCTNMREASEYLDYVQIMSYDLRGGFSVQTGHHTNLYTNAADLQNASVDEGVKAYLEAGVPKEKIVIGVAFYSRKWSGVPDVNHGLIQMAATPGGFGPGYSVLKEEFIDKNGYVRYWDDEAKAPFLYNGDEFITYDDEESIAQKVKYVKENGLGGVMFWEYKCDRTHTLMKALAETMDK